MDVSHRSGGVDAVCPRSLPHVKVCGYSSFAR